ncbi:WD40 repeat domain-containing protein [Streptomyces sp. NPDC020681]|uniref:WD40 repeat domain-containing protein n=1 Tax=Streptomyces sp. NPDC020681 TaxID=3365083 RepID=UPI0037916295
MRGHSDGVRSAAFSSDGRRLATAAGDDEHVVLWDLTTSGHPAKRATWRAHSHHTLAVAFSPTGVLATSGTGEHPVKLWQVTGAGQPKELAALDGQTDAVGDVTFSADGSTLAAGSDDRTTRQWDVSVPAQPRLKSVLTGYTTAVGKLRYARDGKFLVSGVFDGSVRVATTDSARTIGSACDFAGRTVTREEWGRYLSSVPYEPPCA